MDKIKQQYHDFLIKWGEIKKEQIANVPLNFAIKFLGFLNTYKVPCFECGVFYGYKGGYRMGYYMCLQPKKTHRVLKYDMMFFCREPKEFLLLRANAHSFFITSRRTIALSGVEEA